MAKSQAVTVSWLGLFFPFAREKSESLTRQPRVSRLFLAAERSFSSEGRGEGAGKGHCTEEVEDIVLLLRITHRKARYIRDRSVPFIVPGCRRRIFGDSSSHRRAIISSSLSLSRAPGEVLDELSIRKREFYVDGIGGGKK